jgi:hypothetical protein
MVKKGADIFRQALFDLLHNVQYSEDMMDCPKCGYERQPNDAHCTLCGLDFKLHEGLQAEKKALKDRTKLELEGPDEKVVVEPAPSISIDTTEPAMSVGKCPKCGADRKQGEIDCFKCGIVFGKHEDLSGLKQAEEKAAKKGETQRLKDEKARIQREAQEAIERNKEKREREALQKTPATKRETKHGIGKIVKKVVILIVIALLVVATGFLIKVQVKSWQERSAIRAKIAKQKEIERKHSEELKKNIAIFYANQDRIIKKLKTLIDQKKYDLFKKELAKYDSPSLDSELSDVKTYYKEMKLFSQVKQLPGYKYEQNYKIYKELARLRPSNKSYQRKLKYYKAKFYEKRAEDKYREARNYFKIKKPYRSDLDDALANIDEAIKLGKKKNIYRNLKKKLINAKLLFFKGNDKVAMALRDEGIIKKGSLGGQRRLYVWIKNVSQESFYVNVDFFTLFDTKGRKYGYNTCSKGLVRNVKPGETAGGYLYFYTTAKPKKLVFSHVNAGTIYRVF